MNLDPKDQPNMKIDMLNLIDPWPNKMHTWTLKYEILLFFSDKCQIHNQLDKHNLYTWKNNLKSMQFPKKQGLTQKKWREK